MNDRLVYQILLEQISQPPETIESKQTGTLASHSLNMKAEIYWIQGVEPHRIATMPRPRAGDWLKDEIQSLKSEGVDTLVSLLTPEEVRYMDLGQEPESCKACGIEYISFPIPDRETPESKTVTLQLVERLAELVKEGQGVAIHCFAGIGRSSLIAACVLATLGIEPQAALSRIKNSRGFDVPDTPEQREWVYSFVSTMLKRPSEKKSMDERKPVSGL